MARYSYSGNKKHKKKQNHASEYLPYIINDLADEIEVVEQALSGGEEGLVLSADGSGRASWKAISVGGSDVQGVDVKSTAPEKMIIVSGAGSPEVNGNYYLNGERNGYPQYTLENSTYDYAAIFYDNSGLWLLAVERYQPQMFLYYMSTSSAESPELVDGWEVLPFGTAVSPAPTVIAQGIDAPVEAGKALLTDGAGKASWESIGLPFKSYVAVITQDGNTEPPYISREIHNSLGLTGITFRYDGTGQYRMKTSEGWDRTKAIAFYSPLIGSYPNMKFIEFTLGEYETEEHYIKLRSSLGYESFIDGFDTFYLEIRVYD